jgi:hypothetical protein
MPKSLHTIDDHVNAIVETRRITATGQFKPVEPGSERVADVIAGAGAIIADALAVAGFSWSPGPLTYTRKLGIFKHKIRFQGDSDNRSGLHVGVSLHAEVSSPALARWRREHGTGDSPLVWVTQVGYLSDAHAYLKWQLVDPGTRAAEVASMLATVRDHVLPVLDHYATAESLLQQFECRRELLTTPAWALEVAMWLQSPATAQALVSAFLIARPTEADSFWQHLEKFRTRLPRETPFPHAAALAWMCIKYAIAPTAEA